MLIIRTICRINRHKVLCGLVSRSSTRGCKGLKFFPCAQRFEYSTETPVVASAAEETEEVTPLNLRNKKSAVLVAQKAATKVKRKPFAKNLFAGIFDCDVLAFPEVLTKDELQILDDMTDAVRELFSKTVSPERIDKECRIPEEALDSFKKMGLFGLMVPQVYGGVELNCTEYARLSEIISHDLSVATMLSSHECFALQAILMFGTEEQKAKYLPQLAAGKSIAAFCFTEDCSGSDVAALKTRASPCDDGKTYRLKGTKTWVCNGGIADVFLVLAQVPVGFAEKEKTNALTAFIVEKNFGNISCGKQEDTIGVRGTHICSVDFNGTIVPEENILGNVGDGFKVALDVMVKCHYRHGSVSFGFLKGLYRATIEHAINRVQFQKPLMDFEMIQERIAQIACKMYAMESMTYLTAGMLDAIDDPDCSVEASLVKLFSSEEVQWCISECLHLLGNQCYSASSPYERFLRDSRSLLLNEGTSNILKLYVAMVGIQHAGKLHHETVRQEKKLRNPLFNPRFILSRLRKRDLMMSGSPKLTLDLHEHLHPSLKIPAEMLERSVLRFEYAVEQLMVRHGAEIEDCQMELRRVADILTNIYAMTACLSRASRSYCIGLQNAGLEILMAFDFALEATQKINRDLEDLNNPLMTNDMNHKRIASETFKWRGYTATHPLTRNW